MLAHNGEALGLSHDFLDVGHDVCSHDDEMPGVGTDLFIFLGGDGDDTGAIAIAALADNSEVVIW